MYSALSIIPKGCFSASDGDFFTNFLNTLKTFAMTSGLRLIAAAIILFAGFAIVRKLMKVYVNSKSFNKTPKDVQGIVRWTANFLLHILIVILAIAVLGIPLTSAATIISSCAVALGLALQGSLSNLAGGLMILIFKPFHVGDYIDASGHGGTVESIGVFYTTLRTYDNRRIVMPNAALSNTNVVNSSAYEMRRVDITISAGTENNSDEVKDVLLSVINKQELAILEPEPFVRLNDCTDGKLNFTVRVWCRTEDYFDLYNDLQEDIRTAFSSSGIVPALNTMRISK